MLDIIFPVYDLVFIDSKTDSLTVYLYFENAFKIVCLGWFLVILISGVTITQ